MISDVPTEIRNRDFPNTTLKPYRHTNLFWPFQFYKILFEGVGLNVEPLDPVFKVSWKTKELSHFLKNKIIMGNEDGMTQQQAFRSRCIINKMASLLICVGRDNVVGTATRYGLDGPGIESR
jgi:hypothetical protein